MAKTKNINNRPIIIVNVSTQKWGVDRRTDTEQLVTVDYNKILPIDDPARAITEYKIVNVKPETAISGEYKIEMRIGYQVNYLLRDCTNKGWWEAEHDGTTLHIYNSLEACLKTIQNYAKVHPRTIIGRIFTIVRYKETYFNTQTKEVTPDKKVAEKWFKGKNPLFISTQPYQRAGIWVTGGKDYVDVEYYYNNKIQRNDCQKWQKGTNSGFRLYNDGTISNFYKGKVYDRNRLFEEKRVNYRSLDVRFKELYRSAANMADLRAKELIGSDCETRFLSEETLQILKDAGFPREYWCWSQTKRPFNDTYDLINFATHIQHKAKTKKAQSMEEFLADKPFGLDCETVIRFNKGILIRIPGYKEEWEYNNVHYNRKPAYYEINATEDKAHLLSAQIYEKFRVWISDSGKEKSCFENIHDGTCWSQCRWDSVWFADPEDVIATDNGYYRNIDVGKTNNIAERRIQDKALSTYKTIALGMYDDLFTKFTLLSRFKELAERHNDLLRGTGVKNLLTALMTAPKITETLIKLGYENWFYDDGSGDQYYGQEGFSFDKILRRFSLLNTFKEDAHRSFYKNLGLSKEQFNWLKTQDHMGLFLRHFRGTRFLIPGKHEEYYESFADLPLKQVQSLYNIVESRHTGTDMYWSIANKIEELLNSYEFTILDIEKCDKRNLNLQLLIDYLRIKRTCAEAHVEGFREEDWDKIPADQTELRLFHDRIMEFHNLYQADRERYYRAAEETRLLKCQETYNTRYKQIKKLAYQEDNDERIIVVPEKLIELVVEGQVLRHCVGSYTESVSQGRDTIVFLRHKTAPTAPYATIAIRQKDNVWQIDQAHTVCNGPITEEDASFLKRWAKERNVNESTVHTHYGLQCHH
jgi:hypothetical protein